jgi:hypothetical protein
MFSSIACVEFRHQLPFFSKEPSKLSKLAKDIEAIAVDFHRLFNEALVYTPKTTIHQLGEAITELERFPQIAMKVLQRDALPDEFARTIQSLANLIGQVAFHLTCEIRTQLGLRDDPRGGPAAGRGGGGAQTDPAHVP